MEHNLTGKLALVTGASRGIGLAIAKAMLASGAKVIVTGRHMDTLSENTQGCVPIVCDHSDPSSISSLAEEVLTNHGTPDILVNNAGWWVTKPMVELSKEEWDQMIGLNLTGVFLTTKAFLPGMIEKNRGDIFMIASMSGKKGDPGGTAYCASKFGLQGLSQALNYEVRRNNIRVMVLNPSQVDTTEDDGPKEGPVLYLHANDIADTVVHLACLPGRTLIRDMDIWGTNPFV